VTASRIAQAPANSASPLARETRDVELFLLALFGCERHGALIDVRYDDRGETRHAYFAHRDTCAAARTIVRLGMAADVHVGVAPRRRRANGGEQIERVWSLWSDIAAPAAESALELLPVAPSIVVAAGCARVQAYWLLQTPVAPEVAEQANRLLAAQFGGADGAVTAASAMLRPPGTYCFASTPPAPVVLERLRSAMTTVQAVTAALAHDPPIAPAARVPARVAVAHPPIGQDALPAL
jgi:hypothetical protein